VGPDGTEFSAPDPAPFTTIAWRLWHLGASTTLEFPPHDVADGAGFVQAWFSAPPGIEVPAPPTAAEAVEVVSRNWSAFATRIEGFTDDELAAPLGEAGGRWAEAPLFALLLHVIDELIHHGAEIGVLRDLYSRRSALGPGGPGAGG
jgi:hypothetical protein